MTGIPDRGGLFNRYPARRPFSRLGWATVVSPRTNVGAGGNYYNNSQRALKRMNTMMTKLALIRPKRIAK